MVWEQAINFIPFVASAIFVYIGIMLDQKNNPIKLLFLLIGVWLIVIGMANAVEIVESLAGAETEIIQNLEYGYTASMWVAVVSTVYFVIMLLWRVLTWFAGIVHSK